MSGRFGPVGAYSAIVGTAIGFYLSNFALFVSVDSLYEIERILYSQFPKFFFF